MNDLISRQAAINAINSYFGFNIEEEYGSAVQEVINGLPSAQPEQKRGKWIKDKGLYKCSYCNKSWTAWWAGAVPIEQMKKEMPYCPMCGSYNGEESDNAEIC